MAKKLNINHIEGKSATRYSHAPIRSTIYFLIVSEGEKTEPNYFSTFIGQRGSKIVSVKCKGGRKNTTQLIAEAKKIRDLDRKHGKEYDSIWIVFDKDLFPDKDFNNAIISAPRDDIHVAWSNPSFELWYLLHLCNTTKELTPAKCIREIEKIVNKSHVQKSAKPFKYDKASKDFSWLEKSINQPAAIGRAEKLLNSQTGGNYAKQNPCTTVYQLVRQLIGEDKEFNAKISSLL